MGLKYWGKQCLSRTRRCWPRISEPADLHDKDIGELADALTDGPKDLRKRAAVLRWMRNELSHLRPLPFHGLYSYLGWPV